MHARFAAIDGSFDRHFDMLTGTIVAALISVLVTHFV